MTTSSKYLRWIIIGGLFLLPFLPLVVADSMFFPFITGKNFAFRIIIEVIFAAWIVLVLIEPACRPKKSWILWAVVALVAVSTLATIFGANPYRSFWSNYERMDGLISHLHLLALFLILVSTLTTDKLWRWFWGTSLGVSVIVAVYGLLQWFDNEWLNERFLINQGNRPDATFGNASYLAVYMLFHIFLAAFYLFKRETPTWMRWILGTLIVFETIILFNTATRGVILGLIGGVLLVAVLNLIFSRGKVRSWSGAVVLLVSILVFGFLSLRDSAWVKANPVLSRFANISLTEATTESRLIIWGMSWQGFRERPILGWGPDNYNLVFNKYYDPRLWRQELWFDRAHNVVFDWLIAAGALGLFAHLSILGAALYYLWRRAVVSRLGKSLLTGLIAAYFFQNLFIFDNIVSYIMFFAVLAYIGYLSTQTQVIAAQPVKRLEAGASSAVAIVVAVALVFSLYFVNVKPILANRLIIKASSPQDAGPTQNLEYFRRATSSGTFGVSEAREQLIQIAANVQGAEETDEQIRQIKNSFFELAYSEMKKQVERFPGDARYPYFMGMFLNRRGLYEEATSYFQRALELSSRKQVIMTDLANSYVARGLNDKAVEIARAAYELDTDYASARDVLVRAYVVSGQITRAVEVMDEWLERNPEDAQAHITLAAVYVAGGLREEAISELQRAIKLKPEFKEQGEYYISEIRAGRNP